MKNNDIESLFRKMSQYLEQGRADSARDLAEQLLANLFKHAYTQVRGQASAAVMRRLLDMEISIGGEDGDFRRFDCRQLSGLITGADLSALWIDDQDTAPMLSSSVDHGRLADWLMQSDPTAGKVLALTRLRFAFAWMKLFAVETGLLDVDADHCPQQPVGKQSSVVAAAIPPNGRPFTEPLTGMQFVHVPGGRFAMGDTFDDGVEDEKPVHEVALSAFYMAVCPVTQSQWLSLMDTNPSSFIGEDHPVEQVTRGDAITFIQRLNERSPDGLRFSLPTEAQWEYAARSGGKAERYAGGQELEELGWFADNTAGGTAPVRSKSPNGLGLYDMSGNVWEWCRDVYHTDAYRFHERTDPVCTKDGMDRVIRGGSWHLDAWSARCSRRLCFDPDLYGPALGFRLVMEIEKR